jgi:3-phosphoshikimate 1-carboxyvinyltransferase
LECIHFCKSPALPTAKSINTFSGPDTVSINTSNDHRIAMAFAPLAFFGPIQIDNPNVVEKSFPDFWQEIAKIGFSFITPNSK